MTDPLTYVLLALRRAADNSYPWSVTPGEAGALVSEVERLRAENADLRVMVDGLETAAAHEERAAVVAYLRACNKRCHEWDGRENAVSGTYRIDADEIERGYHRTGTKP